MGGMGGMSPDQMQQMGGMGGMGGMPPGMEQMFQGMDPSMMGGGNQEDFMQ